MTAEASSGHIVLGVGAVIWNGRGEVLLVRRANPPRQHEWSLPGGKVELGETLRAALAREVFEETRLAVEILELAGVAELIDDSHYVLVDFSALALSQEPVAGSDASEARWFELAEVAQLELWSETRRIIELSATTMKGRRG